MGRLFICIAKRCSFISSYFSTELLPSFLKCDPFNENSVTQRTLAVCGNVTHWHFPGPTPVLRCLTEGFSLGNLWRVDFKAVIAHQVGFHVVVEFMLWTKQNTWGVLHHRWVNPLDLACWAYMGMRPSQRPCF